MALSSVVLNLNDFVERLPDLHSERGKNENFIGGTDD